MFYRSPDSVKNLANRYGYIRKLQYRLEMAFVLPFLNISFHTMDLQVAVTEEMQDQEGAGSITEFAMPFIFTDDVGGLMISLE